MVVCQHAVGAVDAVRNSVSDCVLLVGKRWQLFGGSGLSCETLSVTLSPQERGRFHKGTRVTVESDSNRKMAVDRTAAGCTAADGCSGVSFQAGPGLR